MKEIMAVIRPEKVNQTRQALQEVGCGSFTARKVQGRGRGKVDFKVLHGAEEGRDEAIAHLGVSPRLLPKRLITLIVKDEEKDKVVQAIINANKTGNCGDGKIFVFPINDAIRVRTGERGDSALTE